MTERTQAKITVRLPLDLKAKLKARATINGRTATAELIQILRAATTAGPEMEPTE